MSEVAVDIHSHCMLPEHWGTEFDRHWKPTYGKGWPSQTPQQFAAAMEPVELAVVFGLRATAAGVAVPSSFVASFCAAAPIPTVGFMALDPTDEDVLDQLDEGTDLDLRGIKLYPVLAQFDPTDRVHDGFYDAIVERNLVVLWHMGATPSPPGDLSITQPLLIDAVARRHPEMVQIIAHMGHPWQRDCVAVLRKNTNVFADISGIWSRQMDGYLALVNAQEWGVVDKLLFGSDYPLWTPREAIDGLWKLTEMQPPTLPKVEPATIKEILRNETMKDILLERQGPST